MRTRPISSSSSSQDYIRFPSGRSDGGDNPHSGADFVLIPISIAQTMCRLFPPPYPFNNFSSIFVLSAEFSINPAPPSLSHFIQICSTATTSTRHRCRSSARTTIRCTTTTTSRPRQGGIPRPPPTSSETCSPQSRFLP